jgi:hypothetical protein
MADDANDVPHGLIESWNLFFHINEMTCNQREDRRRLAARYEEMFVHIQIVI